MRGFDKHNSISNIIHSILKIKFCLIDKFPREQAYYNAKPFRSTSKIRMDVTAEADVPS